MSVITRLLIEAGAEEAARAVALLLRRQAVPLEGVEVLDLDTLAARVAPRALVVSFAVLGGLPGKFALVTTEGLAHVLAHDLVGPQAGDGFSPRALGALTELGNIGASAYLNGVARALETACVPSVPLLYLDDARKALAVALGDVKELSVARLDVGGGFIELCLATTS